MPFPDLGRPHPPPWAPPPETGRIQRGQPACQGTSIAEEHAGRGIKPLRPPADEHRRRGETYPKLDLNDRAVRRTNGRIEGEGGPAKRLDSVSWLPMVRVSLRFEFYCQSRGRGFKSRRARHFKHFGPQGI